MAHNLKKDMDRKFVEEESILTIINRVERRQRLIALMRKSGETADDGKLLPILYLATGN